MKDDISAIKKAIAHSEGYTVTAVPYTENGMATSSRL
jgi:hypothetical protein